MMKKNHAAKRGWRVLALALCLAMLVGLLPTVALAADDETWTSDITIAKNLVGGTASEPLTITVTGTVTVNAAITIRSGYVCITGGGTLVRGSSLTGSMITVDNSATLILDNVTVDGAQISGVNYRGIAVSGTLIMEQGAVLKNHYNSDGDGSVLRINSNGTVQMNGGEIAKNSSYNYGNIYIYDDAQFTMNGGEIHDNTLTCDGEYGGGAFYVRGGTLTVNGGSIYNHTNITSRGGAIYCSSYAKVYLNGGVIKDNTVASGKLGNAIFYSSQTSGKNSEIYIGGDPLITNSIYLDNANSTKYPYITSTIKNQLTLEVGSYSEGRVIAQGADGYQLTTKDLAKITLMAGGKEYYAKLEGNQLLMTNKDPGYTVLYNVSYYGNGATGSTLDNTNYASGDTAKILDSSFSYPGYEFTGWNTAADGTGTAYAVGAEIAMNSDLVLYAQWEKLPQDKVLKIGNDKTSVFLSAGEYIASNGTTVATEVPTDNYAHLSEDGTTLTLKNFVLDAGSIRVQKAYKAATLNIKLEGKNELKSGIITTWDAGEYQTVNLTITGNGSLNAENTGGSTTVYVACGNVTIKDGAKVTLKHNSTGMGETVHAVKGSISISGTGTTLNAVNTGSYGVRTTSGVTVDNNAKVYISGSTAALAGGDLTATVANVQVSNDGTTFAQAKDLGDAKTYKCVKINGAPILSYKVTWNANGGKFGTADTQVDTLTYGTTIKEPETNPTRSGYEFKGWSKTKTGSTTTSFGTVIEDVTYYAQWEETEAEQEYTITYVGKDSDYVINDNAPTTYVASAGATLPKNVKKRGSDGVTSENYTFLGWCEKADLSDTPVTSIAKGTTGNKTFYAKWQQKTFDIVWDFNGGRIESSLSDYSVAYHGETIMESYERREGGDPERVGYKLIGWNTDKNGKGEALTDETLPTTDVTYYAQWELEVYGITYMGLSDAVKQALGNPEQYTVETETFTLNNPTVKGYTFTGWACNGVNELTVTIPKGSTGKRTYSAGFKATEYSISYDLAGGAVASENPTKYTIESDDITLNNPTKVGYTFAGWTSDDLTGATKEVTIAKGSTGDRKYTATWTVNKCTVTWNLNYDGAPAATVDSLDYGTQITAPTDPTRTADAQYTYTFDGWYTATEDGTKVETFGTVTSDVTYYARWTQTVNQYTVTWNANGGNELTGTYTSGKVDYGTAIVAPATPTKTADAQYTYTFDGWYTEAEGGAKVETFGTVASDVTYYAHWTPAARTYTVTFIDKSGSSTSTFTHDYTYGKGMTLPTAEDITSKTGYTFAGWYDNEACTGSAVTEIGTTETGNKTFYLKWTPNTDTPYTVVHGLQSLTDENTYEVKETENLTGTTDTTVTPAVKSYDGFTAPTPQTIKIGADGKTMLLYEYTRNSYKLTYEWTAADGTKHTETESVKYEQKVTPKTMPEVTGYTFSGWSAGEFTMPYHDVKLTGEYTANTYKITYLGMDKATHGTYHPDTHTYDTATVISNPARKDYRFLGWSINGSSRTYTDLTLGAKDYTADITLTAVWQLDIDPKYDVKLPTTGKGDVSARPDPAGEADAVIITVEPDDGYVVKDIEVIDKDGNRLPVRDLGDNRFSFIMPKSDVTVNVTYTERRGFDDVFVRDYYYDAVNWAVENGITEGVGNNLFAPGALCTRAQVVTFLWRSAGCPKAVSRVNPFTDVSRSAYYYEAVLWAVENGITEGMSETSFAPDAVCTRAQVVTFLYRMFRENAATGSTGFNDVPDGAWYAEAVKWAVDNGITTGVGNNLFAPNDECTRGQIVTFLWRAYTQR